MMQTVRAQ